MIELIKLAEIEANAILVANSKLDPYEAVKAWPPQAHHEWLNIYYRQVERNEQARAA